MTGTARERAVAALPAHVWRPDPFAPLAAASAHAAHYYDGSCALCRPDLDDGYGRIVDVVLAAALADVDAIAARIDPTIVDPLRACVLAAWDAAGLDAERFMADREADARRRAADVVALVTGNANAACDPAPESNGTGPSLAFGHEFLPVAGHPDDDECTHRADGTDATYCGEPRAAHDDELGTGDRS